MTATTIHIANFASIETPPTEKAPQGRQHLYQNYFFGKDFAAVAVPGTASPVYRFAPFRVEGALASLNGDNNILRLLFPHSEFTVAMVEEGEGNRLSQLSLKTVWMASTGNITDYASYSLASATAQYEEFYVGVGASFDDTTVELRFRSSMDSVGASFPRRTFTSKNVGILPLNAEVSLR
jgi:hypothetical protein